MPRFFFHLLDGNTRLDDCDGEVFPTAQDAMEHARYVACEVARNAPPSATVERWLSLTDEQGREILRVPLDGSM